MPTGYTCYIEDGKGVSFNEFVWICARAFGALIEMRDDGMDAKIDIDVQKGESYHVQALKDAKKQLADAKAMTLARAGVEARAAYEKAVKDEADRAMEAAEKVLRYKEMLAKAQAWTPPSPDHEGLKKFMIQQITESMKYAEHTPRKHEVQTAVEYKDMMIDLAKHSVEYHEKSLRQEAKRDEERRQWLQDLNKSVPIPKAKKK